MITLARFLIFILFTTFMQAQEETATIEVQFQNIASDDGKMLIGLYDSEENWLKKRVMSKIGKITNGVCTVKFEEVPNGVYAISSYHDENDNDKLDTNFLGIPKEDTGSSNDAPARFGPPEWEDAKFEVKGSTVKQIINL